MSDEPHFRRVWQHYRNHIFKLRFAQLVEQGDISQEDADRFREFIDISNMPTFNIYIYARLGQLSHLENEPGFQSTLKVMERLGLGNVNFDKTSAQPYEEQFWD